VVPLVLPGGVDAARAELRRVLLDGTDDKAVADMAVADMADPRLADQ
jgi:hypothetical protein